MVRALVASGWTLLAVAVAGAAAGELCPSVADGTLAFACDGVCARGQPCMAASPANLTAGCRCFTINKRIPSDYVAFQFLVPFDAPTLAALRQSSPASFEKVSGYNDTSSVAWASNSELVKIAPMSLSTVTTSVTLRGGSSLTEVAKGFVASVEIDEQFLAAQTQVRSVALENFKLGSSANTLVANLPPGVETLEWLNNAMTEFPVAATKLKALWNLDLGFNNIEEVTTAHVVPTLTNLTLNANKITSFTAVYPKLTSLNLAFNKLNGVPAVVPKHSQLTLLNLGGNTIPTFEQAHAVDGIKVLSLFSSKLTKFDAFMPSLEYLDLSNTSLTELPPAIFSHGKLSTLHLKDNAQLKNVSFTNVQANFISTLRTFSIATASLRTDCPTAQKFKFTTQYLTACISETIDLNVILGARVAPVTPSPSSGPLGGITTEDAASSSSSVLAPALGIGAAVVVVGLLIGAFVVRRRRTASASAAAKAETSADYTTGTTGTGDAAVRTGGTGGTGNTAGSMVGGGAHASGRPSERAVSLWHDQELLSLAVRAEDIRDVRKLGSGAFADVWLVQFRQSELLASKRLHTGDSGDSVEAERARVTAFVAEIKLVARLTHERIVAFKGVAWVRESDLQALFEYMEGGDLRSYLARTDPAATPWHGEKLQIAVDVAEALVYVHSFSPPLVHRDLKSRNVLLDAALRAKVTDFGVSRYASEQSTMTAGVGTCRWLAPEVIAGSASYGAAADIFAFGVVLSELDTHALPYADARNASGEPLIDVALLQLVARGALTPSLSAACPPAVAQLARQCFATNPSERPSATEVAYVLRTFKRSLTGSYM